MVYKGASEQKFWNLADLQALAAQADWNYVTQRAVTKARELGYEHADVQQIISLLVESDFVAGFESCDTNGYGLLNCDRYDLTYDSINKNRCAHGDGDDIFLKLAIGADDCGHICAVISIHLQGAN